MKAISMLLVLFSTAGAEADAISHYACTSAFGKGGKTYIEFLNNSQQMTWSGLTLQLEGSGQYAGGYASKPVDWGLGGQDVWNYRVQVAESARGQIQLTVVSSFRNGGNGAGKEGYTETYSCVPGRYKEPKVTGGCIADTPDTCMTADYGSALAARCERLIARANQIMNRSSSQV